jgi:uncharacterized protein (DUF302 family)
MAYYFSKTLPVGFEEAVLRTTEALKQEGFGIITEIDVKETLQKKLGIEFRNYRILGACDPALAREALELEDKVGTMLPCNVVVQETLEGAIEIAAIDPVASMAAIDNPRLKQAAERVREKLPAFERSRCLLSRGCVGSYARFYPKPVVCSANYRSGWRAGHEM